MNETGERASPRKPLFFIAIPDLPSAYDQRATTIAIAARVLICSSVDN